MKQTKEILVTGRIGFVPCPSLNAGILAAHGTRGELDGNYSYKLNKAEIVRNKDLFPNITFLNEVVQEILLRLMSMEPQLVSISKKQAIQQNYLND